MFHSRIPTQKTVDVKPPHHWPFSVRPGHRLSPSSHMLTLPPTPGSQECLSPPTPPTHLHRLRRSVIILQVSLQMPFFLETSVPVTLLNTPCVLYLSFVATVVQGELWPLSDTVREDGGCICLAHHPQGCAFHSRWQTHKCSVCVYWRTQCVITWHVSWCHTAPVIPRHHVIDVNKLACLKTTAITQERKGPVVWCGP